MPDSVGDEISDLLQTSALNNGVHTDNGNAYAYLLIARRVKHVYNSTGQQLDNLKPKGTTNPACIHPEDLDALGIKPGEFIKIESAAGSLTALAEAAPDVKRGVVSMAHAWGDAPEALLDVRSQGASTNRLVDDTRTYNPITGQPRMSAIPVNLSPTQPHE